MIKKKHKSYFLNFLKKNKLKKIYKILNKKIIDYHQLKNINQYLEFNKIQKLYKNGINKILDITVVEDNHIKKIKELLSFNLRKDLLNKTKSKIKTYLDQKFRKINSRITLIKKLNLNKNKFSSFLDILKDKNLQINIEKNGSFKKKGSQKNYFFYYRFSKFLEKLKYQNLLKKFHKKIY